MKSYYDSRSAAVLSKTTETVSIATVSYYTTTYTLNGYYTSQQQRNHIMTIAVLSKTTITVLIAAVSYCKIYYNI